MCVQYGRWMMTCSPGWGLGERGAGMTRARGTRAGGRRAALRMWLYNVGHVHTQARRSDGGQEYSGEYVQHAMQT